MSLGSEFLDTVKVKIEQRLEELAHTLQEGKEDIHRMNEYYWENYTEMDEYGYENFDNQQQLFRQGDANRETRHQMRLMSRLLDSPFFGAVSFCYEDEDEPELFYIGLTGFAPKAGDVPLIYDWRAPVSSLFYDYDTGEASYMAPAGELSGTITDKYQYKIRRGRMIYEFSSDTCIDDEILREELGKNGDVSLKNIIRTIQREQNQIIRNTTDKIMIIQGAAGSGKTSIALHRIAYLLYHDRKRLTSSQVLILSPNGVFSDYISHILPELGEERILEMTLDVYAYHELKAWISDCEDHFDEIERMMRQEKRPAGRRAIRRFHYKQSAEFIAEMDAFADRLSDSLVRLHDITFHRKKYRPFANGQKFITITAEEIGDLFFHRFTGIPLLSRMDAVAERFIDELETLSGNLEQEETDLLKAAFREMYRTTDLCTIYNQLLLELHLPGLQNSKGGRVLLYEDVYPLLYLKYKLMSRRPGRQIRHLIIDEMQDYSYLQHYLLTMLFPCSKTILGDRSQTLEPEENDVLTWLPSLLDQPCRQICLTKSYRNTSQITAYAGRFADTEGIRYFDRQGAPVRLHEEKELPEILPILMEELRISPEDPESFETAAVLTFHQAQALEVYEQLSKLRMDVHLMDRDTTRFLRGITVAPWYMAKGLEFDQVFLLPADDRSSFYRRYHYVGATRALHELSVFGHRP